VLVFCVLTAELPDVFQKHWSTPWHYVADVLFAPVPGPHIPWFDVFVLTLLLVGRSEPGFFKGRARPVETAIMVSIGGFALWAAYGAVTGGSLIDERFQLHTAVMTLVCALAQIAVFRTPKQFRMIGATIVYAALFRFAMILAFYLTIMRDLHEYLDCVTDHGDSILFVTCIVIVVANALHARTWKAITQAAIIGLIMCWCIYVNGRRLAWIGLVGSLLTMYALVWQGPIRRRVNRWLLIGAPVAALYFTVGWSHPTGVFKPIASLQSVSDPNNPSNQSRILEDMGLIVTLQQHPVGGSGFGHKYVEISDTYSVKYVFPQYRYVPHNSVLGLLAFTGGIGFATIWMVFPITAYMAARTYAFAKTPLVRTVAMCAVCEVIIHTNQLWGDIGLNANQGLVVISAAVAVACRLPIEAGAWPAKRAPQNRSGKVATVAMRVTMAEERTEVPGAASS
jgi:hypothetical protein